LDTKSVRYVVNEKGERESVVVPVSILEKIVEELEDVEDARIVEERMKDPEWIEWNKAKEELCLKGLD
jgi:hypothetical protein